MVLCISTTHTTQPVRGGLKHTHNTKLGLLWPSKIHLAKRESAEPASHLQLIRHVELLNYRGREGRSVYASQVGIEKPNSIHLHGKKKSLRQSVSTENGLQTSSTMSPQFAYHPKWAKKDPNPPLPTNAVCNPNGKRSHKSCRYEHCYRSCMHARERRSGKAYKTLLMSTLNNSHLLLQAMQS